MSFDTLQHEYEALSNEHAAVLAARAALQEQHESLNTKHEQLREEYQKACQQLTMLKQRLYGKKSERHVPAESSSSQEALFQVEEQSKEPESTQQAGEEVEVKGHKRRRGSGAKEKEEEAPEGTFPAHLRREEQLIDEKPDEVSDDDLELESEKVTERLAELPGEQYVIKTRRKIYKLKSTGEFVNSSVPAEPLGRCKVDISFVVLLVIRKFLWHLPLYRQHQALKLEGIKLDRASFALWVIKLGKLLRAIAEAIKGELLKQQFLHIDETPVQVGRGKKKRGKSFDQGYYWPFLHPEVGVYFEFRRHKGYQELKDILGGFRGTIVSDAADVYQNFVRDYEVRWQLCWQHIRRNFFEARVSNPERAEEALEYIRALYRVEREIKEHKLTSPEKISLYRKQHSQLILEEFKQWLTELSAKPEAITDDLLSKAISYVLTRWDAAVLFVHDGSLPLDNGADERAIRPLKIGFKNFLFCASEVGAEAAAVFYTLISSAKMHGIHPYYYLLDVARRIGEPGVKAEDLMPHRWKETFASEALPEHLQDKPAAA